MDLFTLTGGFLVSTAVIIPVIYLLSWLSGSMLWGTIGALVLFAFGFTRIKLKKVRFDTSSVLILVFSLAFSTWMMTKTFHGSPSGELFVGSNNVFDFGLAVGLMMSISQGANIPFMSPYFAGLPLFYHFFFNFWAALLEYFRVPLVWAINIPSILSFTALLIMVYYLPQVVAKQKPVVGWIAVALTITNSSLTFWKVLPKLASVWHLPTYPFAGPYDGSVISIFVTLNSYVNQRHLAFAIALGLYIFMILKKQNACILGFLTGILPLWNLAIYPVVLVIHVSLYAMGGKWKSAAIYAFVSLIVGLLWMIPYARVLSQIPVFLQSYAGVSAGTLQWNLFDYIWQNLGILPLVAIIGFVAVPKKLRAIWIPFVVLFILTIVAKHGFEQKTFSFLIITVNVLAAVGLGWIWQKAKPVAVLAAIIITVSGFVDLMPIKNEFAFPLVGKEMTPLISWILQNTPKNAVFVSYSDMIDPVVLAGRRNYFGFYGNIGWYDRSADVRNIYSGDIGLAKSKGISYILVPKWQKNDFPYAVDVKTLSTIYGKAYEDEKFLVFRTEKNGTGETRDPSLPAITVINSLRGNGLGHETDDLTASLKAQWDVTKEAGVHATWLFQYGALENTGMTEFAKKEMSGEEFGLLFEIDRNYAEKAGVPFRGQVAWYASDGLFLNSYDRNERRQLIDAAFAKFKTIFGYYPRTVGAWWIGGDSLSYMQEKYAVVAAMRAADQFNLDLYSIWGTPWNIPYLPSKVNEGIPAASFDESSKVVILQWAIRDPFEGYSDPMYSLQDYPARGYTTAYVDYLSSIYLQKPFGNIVIGLENGGTHETFGRFYTTMLTKARELQTSGKANILLAGDYAQNYLTQKKVFAGNTHFLSTDYDSTNQSFWYISEHYRATVLKSEDTVYLIDLRNYADKVEEDFAVLPNGQMRLRINEPEVIDSMRFPDEKILISTTTEPLSVNEKGNQVELYAGSDKIAYFTPTAVSLFAGSNVVKTFSFGQVGARIRPIYIIFALYVFYFLGLYVAKKDIGELWKEYVLLLVPLFLAFPFLVSSSTFLFDKKESVWMALVSAPGLFPIFVSVYISKILPFVILFVLHKLKRFLYWGYFALIVFTYIHVPYFPLDKTTYMSVFISFVIVAAVFVVLSFFICRKHRSKRVVALCGIAIPVILLYLAAAVVFSRSRFALTTYEINALQMIKNQKKDVIYVEEVDYSVRPIYKAVRPLLYANYRLGQLITGKKWEMVMRPENNILNLSDYDDKLIIIPRYLGTDISEDEIMSLKLKKIFDNAQIALFEKI